jgi:hypothetical protein
MQWIEVVLVAYGREAVKIPHMDVVQLASRASDIQQGTISRLKRFSPTWQTLASL